MGELEKFEELIENLNKLLGKKIFIASHKTFSSQLPFHPQFFSLNEIQQHPFSNYKGFNIFQIQGCHEDIYVLIEGKAYEESEQIRALLSILQLELERLSPSHEPIKNLLDGELPYNNFSHYEKNYSLLIGKYFLLLSYPQNLCEEEIQYLLEISVHSMDLQLALKHHNMLVLIAEEENLWQSCNNLIENILSELYAACTLSLGGQIHTLRSLPEIYQKCLEAFKLKSSYHLTDSILSYDNMQLHRILFTINDGLKEDIIKSVFTDQFAEILDNELEHTIDAFFRSNLNVTDTAKNIYIHRNTLLYRLEKIYKSTGYDLKNFEDSMLFRIAWLLRRQAENT